MELCKGLAPSRTGGLEGIRALAVHLVLLFALEAPARLSVAAAVDFDPQLEYDDVNTFESMALEATR